MYEFFIYDTTLPLSGDLRRNITTVFCPYVGLDERSLVYTLRKHFEIVMPPDTVVLLGTEANHPHFEKALHSSYIHKHLPAITRYVDPPSLVGVCCQGDGSYKRLCIGGADGSATFDVEGLLRNGLLSIFSTRHGIIEGGEVCHYVKPSGAHADRFIRTANVLVRGAEVSFIGFCLLPYCTPSVQRIYTDTAAIDSVALAALALRQQLHPGCDGCPVASFTSYAGLKQFVFERQTESLVLISASTSGHLHGEVVNKGIPGRQIVTLFYLGPPNDNRVLCDITQRGPSTHHFLFQPIENFSDETTCDLCRRGLTPIHISGDQFLPESVKVDQRTLVAEDAPRWLSPFCEQFAGCNVIRAHYGASVATDRVRELFIDVRKLLRQRIRRSKHASRSDDFLSRVDRMILRTAPVTLSRIVHVGDEASRQLALRVKRLVYGRREQRLEIRSGQQINANLPAHIRAEGTTLVVAGCAASGRHLLGISQALRRIQLNRSAQYLIGILRTTDAEQLKYLKSNLQYGDHGSEDFDFHAAYTIYLPGDLPTRYSPWSQEERLLRVMSQNEVDVKARQRMSLRLRELENAAAGEGLNDNLFWKSCSGRKLALRPGFAFWKFDYKEGVTQADVYFTMSAILHHKRHGVADAGARWAQHEHRRIILAPRCFDRFNDGIIQASLLRAAESVELDYTSEAKLSLAMYDIVRFVFENMYNDAGEAAPEFLLAIACGKLRLRKQHISDLLTVVDEHRLPTLGRALFRHIRNNPEQPMI